MTPEEIRRKLGPDLQHLAKTEAQISEDREALTPAGRALLAVWKLFARLNIPRASQGRGL